MVVGEVYYDPAKMEKAAADIRAELRKYESAKKEMDDEVKALAQYWDDTVHMNYVSKYNKELSESAFNVGKAMENYAMFLEESAIAIKKTKTSAEASING